MENLKLVFDQKKWVLFIMAFSIGNSMGTIIPISSTYMHDHGASISLVGGIEALYFLGLSLSSLLINRIFHDTDIKKLIYIGLFLSGICVMLFPVIPRAAAWVLLMFSIGVGVSFHMVGTQTALQKLTKDCVRGLCSGIYTLFFAIGFAVGAILAPMLYGIHAQLVFAYGGSTLFLAAGILAAAFKEKILLSSHQKAKIFKKLLLALLCIFSYGYLETTATALYPVYLKKIHYSLEEVGLIIAVFVIGGILGTLPVTYLSEKIGKEKTILWISLTTLFSVILLLATDVLLYNLLFSFVAGAAIGAMYPLSFAMGLMGLEEKNMMAATSYLTFFYGLGSTTGPLFSSLTMEWFGDIQIFTTSMVLLFTVGAIVCFRKKQSKGEVL